MLHSWHLASLYGMSVIFTFLTPEERPDDERGARRHPVPEAELLTTGPCSLALSPPRLPYLRAPNSRQRLRVTQICRREDGSGASFTVTATFPGPTRARQ